MICCQFSKALFACFVENTCRRSKIGSRGTSQVTMAIIWAAEDHGTAQGGGHERKKQDLSCVSETKQTQFANELNERRGTVGVGGRELNAKKQSR